jgi:hypothetical protein
MRFTRMKFKSDDTVCESGDVGFGAVSAKRDNQTTACFDHEFSVARRGLK